MKVHFKRGLATLLAAAMLCGPAGLMPVLAQDAAQPIAVSAATGETAQPAPSESPATATPTASPASVPTDAPAASPAETTEAAEVETYAAPVSTDILTLSNAALGGTGYDWDGAILTLDSGFTGYKQILFEDTVTDATIKLTGDVTIDPDGASNISGAITSDTANLTIDPNGHTLTLGCSIIYGYAFSIYLDAGALTITGSPDSIVKAAGLLYADDTITLNGSASTLVAPEATTDFPVIASDVVTITSDANVLVNNTGSSGITAVSGVVIDTTSAVTITCGDFPSSSAVMATSGDVTISNGFINATGAIVANDGSITINGDAQVRAIGQTAALAAANNLTIEGDATVYATTTGVATDLADQPIALWSNKDTGSIFINGNATVTASNIGTAGPNESAGVVANKAPVFDNTPNREITAATGSSAPVPYNASDIATYQYLHVQPVRPEFFSPVALNPNGGTVNPTTVQASSITGLPALPNPTYTGFDFVGWFTEKDGGTKVVAGDKLDDINVIYAHWTPTSTPTPSKDPTPTPSKDPTPSGQPTPSKDPSPSGQPTPSTSPVPSGQPTPSGEPTPSTSPAPGVVVTPTSTPEGHGDIGPAIEDGTWGKDTTPTASPAPKTAAKPRIPQTGDAASPLLCAVVACAALGGLGLTIKRKKK